MTRALATGRMDAEIALTSMRSCEEEEEERELRSSCQGLQCIDEFAELQRFRGSGRACCG